MNKYILLLLPFITLSFSQGLEKNQNCLIAKKEGIEKIKKTTMVKTEKNVLGSNLEIASLDPITGFYRNGFCSAGIDDKGIHVVAAVMTDEFLQYSKQQGNDLITPNLKFGFQGLKAGDVWCLCAKRWQEAFHAKVAPQVLLNATNQKALEYLSLEDLIAKAKR